MPLNSLVRNYWQAEPCGTTDEIVGDLPAKTREWFARLEEHRYTMEPFIHSIAQFTRYRGKKIFEVGAKDHHSVRQSAAPSICGKNLPNCWGWFIALRAAK